MNAKPLNTEMAQPVIFGLTYLEEDAAEINDVVGCLMPVSDEPGDGGGGGGGGYPHYPTATGCDDQD